MKFFRLFTMFIVILRSFYIIYVEISYHLIVPLKGKRRLTAYFVENSSATRKVSMLTGTDTKEMNTVNFVNYMHKLINHSRHFNYFR